MYLPGSMPAGFFAIAALLDGRLGERAGLQQPQLVERLRRPARSRPVGRPRRQVVVGGGEPVVGEQPLRARHGLHRRLRLDEPGRHDLLLLAERDRRLDRRRAPLGRRRGGVVEVRVRWAHRSAAPRNGIASGFSGETFAISSAFRNARCRLASSNCAVVTVPERLPKLDVMARLVPDDAPEVVAVLRAKRRLARSLPLTRDKRLLGLAERQHAVGQGLWSVPWSRSLVYRPVLRMLTRAKRAIGQPWLTELLCDGWPLPSLNAPPS